MCASALGVRADTDDAVTARMRRQEVLDTPGHRFHLLIGQAALLRTVGSAQVMADQIRVLLDTLTARENVRIGIIPIAAEFLTPATNFIISDTTRVDTETLLGAVEVTTGSDIVIAERSFELLARQAAYHDDACTLLNHALATHTTGTP